MFLYILFSESCYISLLEKTPPKKGKLQSEFLKKTKNVTNKTDRTKSSSCVQPRVKVKVKNTKLNGSSSVKQKTILKEEDKMSDTDSTSESQGSCAVEDVSVHGNREHEYSNGACAMVDVSNQGDDGLEYVNEGACEVTDAGEADGKVSTGYQNNTQECDRNLFRINPANSAGTPTTSNSGDKFKQSNSKDEADFSDTQKASLTFVVELVPQLNLLYHQEPGKF